MKSRSPVFIFTGGSGNSDEKAYRQLNCYKISGSKYQGQVYILDLGVKISGSGLYFRLSKSPDCGLIQNITKYQGPKYQGQVYILDLANPQTVV